MLNKIKEKVAKIFESPNEKSEDSDNEKLSISIDEAAEAIYKGMMTDMALRRLLTDYVKNKVTALEHKDKSINYRNCELGNWLYGDGKKLLGGSIDYQVLEVAHLQAHLTSDFIIKTKEAGDNELATATFRKEYIPLANVVQRQTTKIYRNLLAKAKET